MTQVAAHGSRKIEKNEIEGEVEDYCPFDLTPEFFEKLANIKRPPFDFKIPDYLEEDINALIECLESKNWLDLGFYEDAVHGSSRSVGDIKNQYWLIDYYSDEGWLK